MATGVDQIAPPLAVSFERTIDLAQQVVIDELRLWQLELQERLGDALRRGVAIGLGVLCLSLAWVVAWAAAVVALEPWFSLEARLLVLAISQLLLGGVALWLGLRSRRAAG
jgi:hypothetical protein